MGVPLRKNVQFQLLWLGGAVSQFGTTMTTVVVPLLVVALTGSYFWAGAVAGARADRDGTRRHREFVVGIVFAGISVGGVLGSLLCQRIALAPGKLIVAVLVVFGLSNIAMALPFGVYWPFVPLMVTSLGALILLTAAVAVFTDLRTSQPTS
jgi:hypothetical protein